MTTFPFSMIRRPGRLCSVLCMLLPLCGWAAAAEVSYPYEFAAAWEDPYDSLISLESSVTLALEGSLEASSDRTVTATDGAYLLELSSESGGASLAGGALRVDGNAYVSGVTLSQACRDALMFYSTGDMNFSNVTVSAASGAIGSAESSMTMEGGMTLSLSHGLAETSLFSAGSGIVFKEGFNLAVNLSENMRPGQYTLFSNVINVEEAMKMIQPLNVEYAELCPSGDDIVLKIVPEPSCALLAASAAMWLLIRRRRNIRVKAVMERKSLWN